VRQRNRDPFDRGGAYSAFCMCGMRHTTTPIPRWPYRALGRCRRRRAEPVGPGPAQDKTGRPINAVNSFFLQIEWPETRL
jgi:hypothetical protein